MGQLGCHSGVAPAAAGGPTGRTRCQKSQDVLPAQQKGWGWCTLPSAPPPQCCSREGELLGLPTHQGALGDERHCRNDMVWGADAGREDEDRAGFLSSSLGKSGSSFLMLPVDSTPWDWAKHLQTPLQKSQLWAGGVTALLLSQ